MGRATHVLLVGGGGIHRAQVLRAVGYAVDECPGLSEMVAWFRAGHDADMVCISEGPEYAVEDGITLAKAYTRAPLVLFHDRQPYHIERDCELDVPLLTQPTVWLPQIAALLTRAPDGAAGLAGEATGAVS